MATALTNRIVFSAYRKNQFDLNSALGVPAIQGVSQNLPNALCNIYPAPANTIANGVTMQSIIEELPTGLYKNGQSTKYYTPTDIATLQTSAGG